MAKNQDTIEQISSLKADCENCFGLCCVALPFTASADFAVDKNAGKPCHNLNSDYKCGVHTNLRELGFKGCTVFDCFGAGQKVSNLTFNGNSWRNSSDIANQMFEVFPIMKQLHEMIWYLTEALNLKTTSSIHKEIREMLDKTEQITRLSPESILEVNVSAHRAEVNILLLRTSELVRDKVRQNEKYSKKRQKFGRGLDLMGANLKGADLRGENLRGAYLIAADLRKADLRMADLIGVDFRDADLSGADLTGSIFLTQAQINSAKGDDQTKLPSTLTAPAHW